MATELLLTSAAIELPQKIENLEQLKAELAPKLEYYKNLVVTEDSIKAAKADKANLNKLKKAIDSQRISIKTQYLTPYMVLESQCKELIRMIDEPVNAIDEQLRSFDEVEKAEKLQKMKLAFYNTNHHDWVRFEMVCPEKWGNKTMKTEQCIEYIEKETARIEQEFSEINQMYSTTNFLVAILEKYQKTRDKAETLAYALTLERQYQEQQKRIAEEKQHESLKNAPVSVSESGSTVTPTAEQTAVISESERLLNGTFRVSCTKTQLIALRDFMKSQGIKFELVK